MEAKTDAGRDEKEHENSRREGKEERRRSELGGKWKGKDEKDMERIW